MPDKGLKNSYLKFATSLMAAIRRLSLYPPKHPAAVYSIKSFSSILLEVLNTQDTVNIGITPDNQIFIEESLFVEKDSKLTQDLASHFKKLDIESLTFKSGITSEELDAFMGFLLMGPEEIKKIGDLNKAFLNKGIQHISIAQFSYIKVQRGKTVLEIDKQKKELFEKLKSKIQDYSLGKISKPEDVQGLEQDVINATTSEYSQKKRLSPSTKNMLTGFALQTDDREGLFSGLNNALLTAGCSAGQANKLIDKIKGETFKKLTAGKIQKPEDVAGLQKDIINMAAVEYGQKKRLSPSTKSILTGFARQTDDREGLFSNLNNALLSAGCSAKETDKLIGVIRKETTKKPAGAAQLVGARADESLLKDNESLKLKISQLQKELALKTTSMEVQKKENRRNAQEKERVDNIIHHMSDGLVVVDPKGNIIMLNPVAEKLLAVDKRSVGMPLNKTIRDEHLLTLVKKITPDKDGTVQKDVELLGPDESTKRVLRTSSAVVEDGNGKTVGMVTILNDITRQKEIERMKSQFVANVSHELRTPLATIQQNISLLSEGMAGVLNEDQVKFLNSTQSNIKRLKRLINDLLDSAAIEAGKFKLRLSRCVVNQRINNVVVFLNQWAQSKKISIQTHLLPQDEAIEMDKDRIEQVLTNLLSNAIKFSLEGTKISVSAISREPAEQLPQGAVEISVQDFGPGIAPEDVKKIFEKFERAGAVNSGIGGTGLGLSICKEIVRMHGGRIWVESKLNQGSKFSFLLPKGQMKT